ncbi:MAG: T9SS type A sorting domain-containing protein [Bacteroidales bacterium]|nr:T9SS type A sorting domain-containing protein [Bacteroidales bacterium]
MKNFTFLVLAIFGLFSANSITGQNLPEINIADVEAEYMISQDVELTATVVSNGNIDQLCGIGYEFYRNNEPIENIDDFGSVNYSFRIEGSDFYNGEITQGSGMLEIEVAEDNISAFTLGMFDTYCVNRNRPINIVANFNEIGNYKVVISLYSCENDGEEIGTGFTANTDCDGEYHLDLIDEICENPNEIVSKEIEINVVGEITIIDQPQSTSICNGGSTILSVNAVANNGETLYYQWRKNGTAIETATSSTLTVYTVGEYYCSLIAGSASLETEHAIIDIANPIANLDSEITVCPGESTILNPGDFASYLWSDNSTEASLTVSTTGAYGVTVTDEFGCTADASTQVIFAVMPEEFSFKDTTICYGVAHALEGPLNNNYSYLWNTGSTNYSITFEEAGTYSLTVTNEYGCTRTNSANIDFEYTVDAKISDAYEVHSCSNEPNVKLGPISGGSIWLWSNGSTARTNRVTQPGIYSVIATDTITGCIGVDTVEVFIHQIPELDLGGDKAYCADQSLTLSVQEDDCEYIWNTGDTSQSIDIEESGFYSVIVTDDFGCWSKDSLNIEIYPMPRVNLGEDFEMYENQTAILTTEFGNISYVWSLGPEYTEHFVTLSSENLNFGPNVISVTAITVNGCEDSDQVTVTLLEGVNINTENAEMFYVYPNPTSGIIKINGENIEKANLYDSLGRIVFTTESNEFDMSDFANGNYTLIIYTQQNSYSTKIVKQ